ncbi:MAG: hypothetical protein IJF32_13480 [Oscillospiraceae bacterium]|nr:hypothetical protein [Oscillospiraceae bacterium]MBQ6901948.1 hypothetical protein [Oscillospiraceae bacterium]
MSEKILAGVSRVEISTDKKKINDPLYAKTLVLESEGERYAFVSLDYVSMGGGISELSDGFFGKVKEEAVKLGVNTFVCGVTHTHTFLPMIMDEETVLNKVVEGIKTASAEMVPVTVGSDTGRNSDFIINRTLILKDGSSWSIRQAHPCPPDDEIKEIAYADDSVGVIRFDREDKSPLCVMFTFGCHPLLGYANNLPTGNYPGIAEALVEKHTGAMAMMFQSCGGDVTEIDYKSYDKPKNCEVWGERLGLSVLDTMREIKTETVEIKSYIKRFSLPRRKDIPAVREKVLAEREALFEDLGNCPLDFKSFLPLYMKYLTSPDYPLGHAYEYIKEDAEGKSHLRDQDKINRINIEKYLSNILTMEKLSKLATTLETLKWHEDYNASFGNADVDGEVVGIRLGDAVLITTPVEPLSETGRRIRALSPYEKTFVLGYSNGYMHYGAPKEIYNNGGYETIECMLGDEWLEIYEAAAKAVIDKIK